MTRDLDPFLLRIFLTCVSSGSIGRAAQVLGRSQPTVSEQLRRLEDIVGVPLLIRSHDGVSLTPKGHQLLPYARQMVQLSSKALNTMREATTGRRLGLGVLDDLMQGRFPVALAAIRDAYPDVSLEVVSLPVTDIQAALLNNRV